MPMNINPINNVITRHNSFGSTRLGKKDQDGGYHGDGHSDAKPSPSKIGFMRIYQVTSHVTVPLCSLEWRHNFFADFSQKEGAARVERATGWQLQENSACRHSSTQFAVCDKSHPDPLPGWRTATPGYMDVEDGYDPRRRTDFHQTTQIHHTNASLPGEIFC